MFYINNSTKTIGNQWVYLVKQKQDSETESCRQENWRYQEGRNGSGHKSPEKVTLGVVYIWRLKEGLKCQNVRMYKRSMTGQNVSGSTNCRWNDARGNELIVCEPQKKETPYGVELANICFPSRRRQRKGRSSTWDTVMNVIDYCESSDGGEYTLPQLDLYMIWW